MVNTFLVCRDISKSASILDNKRLLKQCVEAKQIINIIDNNDKRAWRNHPVVIQWKDHVDGLKHYYNIHLAELYKRNILKSSAESKLQPYKISIDTIMLPWFVNCPHYWYSHCASLYRKKEWHYKDKLDFPSIYKNYGYFWPSKYKDTFDEKVLMTNLCNTEESKNLKQVEKFLKQNCDAASDKVNRCLAYTKNDFRCDNPAKSDSLYCGVHLK